MGCRCQAKHTWLLRHLGLCLSYLHGRALRRQGCETHNVAEVDGDAVKSFGLDRLPTLQLLSH